MSVHERKTGAEIAHVEGVGKRKLEVTRDAITGAAKEYKLVQVEAKKQKDANGNAIIPSTSSGALVSADSSGVSQIARTSNLHAPNMLLAGHAAAIHACQINHEGTALATASSDKFIFLWDIYGECENWGTLKGHKAAVLDLAWHHDGALMSASADQTGAMWDPESCGRVRRFRGHTGVVNAIAVNRRGECTALTGSDDCSAKLWDVRWKHHSTEFLNEYQVTAVEFSDDSSQIFTAGIDEVVKCWDVRTNKVLYSLEGHRDTVTGIELSPDGKFLLSNAMDAQLKIWDVQAYVSGDTRLVSTLTGHSVDLQQLLLRCAWSPDGNRVACGSSDRFVYVWDVPSSTMLYKLPGHQGAVTQVDFHPKEPIIASCGIDKRIYLGEIKL